MSAGNDAINKTWIPLASRPRTDTFNASGNVTIPYGRYRATVEGRAGTGIPGNIATYNTNYNVAYPIGTRPIANQPIANYNVAYPLSGYNVVYPVANYNTPTPGNFVSTGVSRRAKIVCSDGSTFYVNPFFYIKNSLPCPSPTFAGAGSDGIGYCQSAGRGNVTEYNIQYFCAFYFNSYNSPTPGNANYNVAYPANYNVAYPAGNYNTNYNTNYNVAYPIANRPAATYNPGNPGAATNVLGVTFPGGGVLSGIGQLAPFVPATVVNYWQYPDGAPSATYPVTVPSGGQIIVKIE